NEFEDKECYKLILLDMEVNKSKKTNQGDNRIDIIVSYKGYTFLVQCKNYDDDNANHGNAVKSDIMKFD
ncbi:225_t:CDS:2, partial [Gigaspora margarita]